MHITFDVSDANLYKNDETRKESVVYALRKRAGSLKIGIHIINQKLISIWNAENMLMYENKINGSLTNKLKPENH